MRGIPHRCPREIPADSLWRISHKRWILLPHWLSRGREIYRLEQLVPLKFAHQEDEIGVQVKLEMNMKVLRREHKRHTACRVASARYAALSNGWGVSRPGWGVHQVPPTIQTWLGGTLGIPLSRPWMGYPLPTQTLDGIPPPRPGMGYPPHTHRPVMGYPLPASVKRVKILPSPILRMRTVKRMKRVQQMSSLISLQSIK